MHILLGLSLSPVVTQELQKPTKCWLWSYHQLRGTYQNAAHTCNPLKTWKACFWGLSRTAPGIHPIMRALHPIGHGRFLTLWWSSHGEQGTAWERSHLAVSLVLQSAAGMGVLQQQLQAALTPWDMARVLWLRAALVEPHGGSGCWGTLRLLGRLAQASCPWRGGANPREIRARGDV